MGVNFVTDGPVVNSGNLYRRRVYSWKANRVVCSVFVRPCRDIIPSYLCRHFGFANFQSSETEVSSLAAMMMGRSLVKKSVELMFISIIHYREFLGICIPSFYLHYWRWNLLEQCLSSLFK